MLRCPVIRRDTLARVTCVRPSGHLVPHSDSCLALTGESIPIRLFLAGYELTPTMRDINKKFSVRYYLNLVLIDEEERRYFKQQVRLAPPPDPWGPSNRTRGRPSAKTRLLSAHVSMPLLVYQRWKRVT